MAKNFPPGPKGSALAGSLRELNRGRLEFLVAMSRTYGDIVHFRMGPLLHVYMLNNPEFIHYALVEHPEKFNRGPGLKRTAHQALGKGLLTSEGDFHKRQRKLVQPAFHAARITSYGEVMVDHTLRMMDEWQPGQERDIHSEMMKLTLGIVSKTLFDAEVSAEAEAIGEAITVGIHTVNERTTQPFHLPDWIPTRKNRRRRQAADLMERTIMRIINERRASGEDKGDLLSMLLLAVDEDSGGQMTRKQARDEAMTLFIAGHETTANALSWTWCLLAQHPEIMTKLTAELDSVVAGRPPQVEDLARLPYTDMIIKEVLRLYPPAWAITRQPIEDVTLGGYNIPNGSLIIMSQYAMHHDPRYFDDPERFDPERFSAAHEKDIPRYTYFPFGGGPRVCIGQSFAMMEARLILATMAQRYELALEPGQRVEMDPLVTLRPRDGIPMRLVARELPHSLALSPIRRAGEAAGHYSGPHLRLDRDRGEVNHPALARRG